MSIVVGGITSAHSPSIMAADDGHLQDKPEWKPLFAGMSSLQRWLENSQPDLLVIVTNDHVSHYHPRWGWPTFGIAAAPSYPIADEGKGARDLPPIPSDPEFAMELAREMISQGIDLSIAHEYAADHGVHSPLPLVNGNWRWPVVILHLNTIFQPLPTPKRCWDFGMALGESLRAMPDQRRVALLGLGGMSHELTGPRFGMVNAKWDRSCLDMLSYDPTKLLSYTTAEVEEYGGSEGLEIYHWLAVRCAIGIDAVVRSRFYYPHRRMGYGGMAFETPEATESVTRHLEKA